jgi:hypothetical protein
MCPGSVKRRSSSVDHLSPVEQQVADWLRERGIEPTLANIRDAQRLPVSIPEDPEISVIIADTLADLHALGWDQDPEAAAT